MTNNLKSLKRFIRYNKDKFTTLDYRYLDEEDVGFWLNDFKQTLAVQGAEAGEHDMEVLAFEGHNRCVLWYPVYYFKNGKVSLRF